MRDMTIHHRIMRHTLADVGIQDVKVRDHVARVDRPGFCGDGDDSGNSKPASRHCRSLSVVAWCSGSIIGCQNDVCVERG